MSYLIAILPGTRSLSYLYLTLQDPCSLWLETVMRRHSRFLNPGRSGKFCDAMAEEAISQ